MERCANLFSNTNDLGVAQHIFEHDEWGGNLRIGEFQEMMRRLYIHRDSKRGIDGTYNWLVDEVKELGEALSANNKGAREEEFADVIAWLASLANVVNVDLEKATLTKYNHRCPKCGHSPCECTF